MKINLEEVTAFLQVEGRRNPKDTEEVGFQLPRQSGQLQVAFHCGRSQVEIRIVGVDSTTLFWATLECESVTVDDRKPSKLASHIEMVMSGSSLDISTLYLFGPPGYACELVYADIKLPNS